MRLRSFLLTSLIVVGGCAPTTSTGTLPIEVLVVLDGASESLLLIPVDSTNQQYSVSLAGIPDFSPRQVVARGGTALVSGDENTIVVVDLESGTIPIIRRNTPGDVLLLTEGGLALVGSTAESGITRIDVSSGQLGTGQVPGGVGGFALARGQFYAAVANRIECAGETEPCESSAASWVAEIRDGEVVDSIPISGPGNAIGAVSAPDGLLYVVNSGDGGGENGRLSVIDPVARTEIASYGNIGPGPHLIASDGSVRILIASNTGGMMVYDINQRRITRGFGLGIPVSSPASVVSDLLGRVYVIQLGGCTVDNPGRIRVFGQDLVERLPIELACPTGVSIGEVPADLFSSEGT